MVAEVPTGALADLIGKKRTLAIAFALTAAGEVAMAFSSSFVFFSLAYVVMGLGYSFYSGTIDAFMYDSLVEDGAEDRYPAVLSRSSAYLNISTAIATIVGGLLYRFWGGLPFLITGLTKIVGLCISLMIKEPKVAAIILPRDTLNISSKFSMIVFSDKEWLAHLFNRNMVDKTLLLILMGSFSTVAYEILDDVAVVDWGYNATGISILYTAVIVLSVPSGLFYDRVARRIKPSLLVAGGILILGINYLFAPLINSFIWTTIFLVRVVYGPIKKAAITETINQGVTSNIRATTLSTYELLIRIPFVVFGVAIGSAMQGWGVRNFSMIFSFTLLGFFAVYLLFSRLRRRLAVRESVDFGVK